MVEQTVARLQEKIRKLTQQGGMQLDDSLQSDLFEIMGEHSSRVKNVYPEGSFARLLWDEQLKALSLSDLRQVRWPV